LQSESSVSRIFLPHKHYIAVEQPLVAVFPRFRFYDFARTTAHESQEKQQEYKLYDNARVRFVLVAY
jgi:hypothetical protein